MGDSSRYVPLIRNTKVRTAIGLALLVFSQILGFRIGGGGQLAFVLLIPTVAWGIAVFFTEKYVHKYPQRYFSYLIASHSKAALTMACCLWVMGLIVGPISAPHDVLWAGYSLFIIADVLASVPCRRQIATKRDTVVEGATAGAGTPGDRIENDVSGERDIDPHYIEELLSRIRADLDRPEVEFIEKNVEVLYGSTRDLVVLDDVSNNDDPSTSARVGLLVGRMRINDVRRLNRFLMFCARRIKIGGFIFIRYTPFENVVKDFKRRYKGVRFYLVFLAHFVWYRAIPKIPWLDRIYFSALFSWLDTLHLAVTKKRNRALSRAEAWGRLSFWGMRVVAESEGDGELYVIAQRVSSPVQNKIPSYYLLASLEKVGLDGQIIRTHKIRTMYPFSEFIQHRVYEDHGLSATGKFSNDFRLTDYGRFLRKYWLDELPQIFDWLRGDIKLVGMRATSPHFLSLYPKEVYDLYIQVKPGLIPPIFGQSTEGFDHIVEVELAYLKSYLSHPILTDVRCFWKTFADIVFRGVRSK